MRKLFGVWLLIACLTAPVFAGHTLTGGGGFCAHCDNITCICDDNEQPMQAVGSPGSNTTDQPSVPGDAGSEILLVLASMLLWLRFRA